MSRAPCVIPVLSLFIFSHCHSLCVLQFLLKLFIVVHRDKFLDRDLSLSGPVCRPYREGSEWKSFSEKRDSKPKEDICSSCYGR